MKKILRFFGCSPRRLLMRLLGRFHAALLVAIVCAAVYEVMGRDPTVAYLRGLLLFIPMALSYYAAERLPSLWQYLLAMVLLMGLAWLLLGHPGGAAAMLLVCILRARMRLSEDKAPSYMDVPHYAVTGFFVVPFVFSAFVDLPGLQKLSVLSAAVYFLIALLYRGIQRVEEYLLLNRAMDGLPAARIQRTAGAAVLAAVLLSAILLLPAALSVPGTFHMELPEKNYSASNQQLEQDYQEYGTMQMAPNFGDDDGKPLIQFPPFLSYLIYAVVAVAVVSTILYGIYLVFKNFRASYTDSHDVVQFLHKDVREKADLEEAAASIRRPGLFDRSPNATVRRRYRKAILKAGKETPQRWQTPEELEAWAGLHDPRLHALYEKARYSPTPCTQEDLKLLKR